MTALHPAGSAPVLPGSAHPERGEGMWAATLRLQAFLLQVTARQARDIDQLRDEIVRLTVEGTRGRQT